jgi:hypothetical protein
MSRKDCKTLDKALQRSKFGEGSIKDAQISTARKSKSGKGKGLWNDNDSSSQSSEEDKDDIECSDGKSYSGESLESGLVAFSQSSSKFKR